MQVGMFRRWSSEKWGRKAFRLYRTPPSHPPALASHRSLAHDYSPAFFKPFARSSASLRAFRGVQRDWEGAGTSIFNFREIFIPEDISLLPLKRRILHARRILARRNNAVPGLVGGETWHNSLTSPLRDACLQSVYPKMLDARFVAANAIDTVRLLPDKSL